MGCNCCEEPPCPAPWIESKTISAMGSKESPPTPCGYSYDGSYWATKTTTSVWSGSEDGAFGPGSTVSWALTSTATSTKSLVGGVCTESAPTYSGSSTYNVTGPSIESHCTATLAPNGTWSGSVTESYGGGEPETYSITESCAAYGIPTVTPEYSGEVTPEPGETTAAMISRVTSDLPDWPDDWSAGSGTASRNLSPDESSFSVSRFKWRVKHQPTGLCYLKAWLRKVETPEEGDPIVSDLPPYTWNGSPCLQDASRVPWAEENLVAGSESEIGSPSEDGSITVEVFKWSCVPGYEPPDDGTANGYPPAETPE